MKRLLLLLAGVVLIAIAVGMYMERDNDLLNRADDNGPSDEAGLSDRVRSALIGSTLIIPEYDEVSVELGERENPDTGETYIGAEYEDTEDMSVRAFVSVVEETADTDGEWTVDAGAADGMVAVPFYVNYGGSGSFLYVGLLEFDGSELRHLDSFMLGDRVELRELLALDDDMFAARFLDRHESQGAAAEPTVPAEALFSTTGGELAWQRTYTNADSNLIRVDEPEAGEVAGIESLMVRGEARGNWYFEADFPVDLVDDDGSVIGETYATAQGEWMTEDFVPFEMEPFADVSYTGDAVLVLRRDNASGLPENDASVAVPVVIE